MEKSIFGLAKNENHAQKVLSRLQAEGFSTEYISFLVYDRENRLTRKNARGQLETNPEYFSSPKKGTISHEKHTKAPEGAATGATTGGIIGGSLGLLAGLGAIAIPGLGAFVAAGPILAALSGSAVGGSLGLLIGALVGLGLPEYEAKKYENHLKAGRVLICVQSIDSDEIERAKEILNNEGIEDISTVSEKARSRR